jgi:tetratricopeptide (TPR) repeat protein
MDTLLTVTLLILFGEIGLLLVPVLIGALHLRRHRYARALPWFRYAYALSRFIRSWRGVMALNLCACHVGLGDYAAALSYAEEAVRETDRLRQRRNALQARGYLGIVLTRLGEYARAEQLFNEALNGPRLRPRLRTEIESCAATTYVHLGRLEEAARLLEKVISEAPSGSDMQIVSEVNLSSCLYFSGKPAEALKMARHAARKKGRVPWIHDFAQAACMLYLTELGEIAEAQTLQSQLLQHVPDQTPHIQGFVFRATASLALRYGDLDRARDYAERAYGLDPNPNAQAAALLLQAEVFAAHQNSSRASALCAEILRLNPMEFYERRAEDLQHRLSGNAPLALSASTEETPAYQKIRI